MALVTIAASLLLLPSSSAIPLTPRQPQPASPSASVVAIVNPVTIVNSNGQENDTASTEFICNFESQLFNPGADLREIWDQTGASTFLNSYLVNNTDQNWAIKLAAQEHDSELSCTDITEPSLCTDGSKACDQVPDPAYFFIRQAATNCFAFFNAASTNNTKAAVVANAAIPTLVQDFGAPPASDDNGSFLENVFSGIFGAASSAAGLAISDGVDAAGAVVAADPAVDAVGAAFGLLSAIFSIASAAPSGSSTPPDPTAQLQAQVGALFSQVDTNLANIVATIFNGGSNTASLPGIGQSDGPNGETQNVAKFFADGIFLSPVNQNSPSGFFTNGVDFLLQSIVSSFLKMQNYYIFIDTSRSPDDCAAIAGSQFLNGQCYTIEQFNPNGESQADISSTTIPIDSTLADKLPAAPYNFTLSNFYLNAADCQNAFPDFSGAPSNSVKVAAGGFPQCFFNMPVITAQLSPCNALSDNLPSNLGFTEDTCQRFILSGPPGGIHSTPKGPASHNVDVVVNGTNATSNTTLSRRADGFRVDYF